MEETSGRSILGRHQSCYEERIEVLADSIERHHPSRNTFSAYCSPNVVRMETGEVTYKKENMSPRPPPKIYLKHDWKRELDSEVVRQPVGEVVQQSKSSQSSQPNPDPDHDRTEKPVVCPQRGASRFQEIKTRSFREEAVKHDRTGETRCLPR